MEEWRPVVGYEGWYEVSNLGRVRRVKAGTRTHHGRVLKGSLSHLGYVRVGFTCGSHDSLRHHFVHALVCQAFIGPRPTWADGVNHRNGIKTDNRVANLEWATSAQNSAHAVAIGLMPRGDRSSRRLYSDRYPRGDEHHTRRNADLVMRGERNGMTKLTTDIVRDIRTSPLTARLIAAQYGVSSSLVYQVRSRTIWSHVS